VSVGNAHASTRRPPFTKRPPLLGRDASRRSRFVSRMHAQTVIVSSLRRGGVEENPGPGPQFDFTQPPPNQPPSGPARSRGRQPQREKRPGSRTRSKRSRSSRSRSISMSRVLGGYQLQRLVAGAPNASQHACCITSVLNLLYASVDFQSHPEHQRPALQLPDDILALRRDPAAITRLAGQHDLVNGTVEEAVGIFCKIWPEYARHFAIREYAVDVGMRSAAPLIAPRERAYAVVPLEKLGDRKGDPWVAISATQLAVYSRPDHEGEGAFCQLIGEAAFVVFEQSRPYTAFNHFPEVVNAMFGAAYRLSGLVVKHPTKHHFVTIARRGNSVFLLDDDAIPVRLFQKQVMDPANIIYWLQTPLLALVIRLPSPATAPQQSRRPAPPISVDPDDVPVQAPPIPRPSQESQPAPAPRPPAAASADPPASQPPRSAKSAKVPAPAQRTASPAPDARVNSRAKTTRADEVTPDKQQRDPDAPRNLSDEPLWQYRKQARQEQPRGMGNGALDLQQLRCLQWNMRGHTTSKLAALPLEQFDVIFLQECGTCSSSLGSLVGWRHYVAGRQAGGAAILVRANLVCAPVNTGPAQDYLDVVAIQLDISGEPLTLASIYHSSRAEAMLWRPPPGALLLAGDFNAHSLEWSTIADDRGNELSDFVDDIQAYIANTGEPTREAPHLRHQPTAPDVTIARGVDVTGWATEQTPLSDHRLITFVLGTEGQATTAQRMPSALRNYVKANWPLFQEKLDEGLRSRLHNNWLRSSDVCALWTAFKEAVIAAATRAIPTGVAGRQADALGACRKSERFKELSATIADPLTAPLDRLAAVRARHVFTNDFLRDSWEKAASSLAPDSSAAWKILRRVGLTQNNVDASTSTIAGKARPRDKANALAKAFFPRCRTRRPRQIRSAGSGVRVTDAEFKEAMRHVPNGKAPGPDGVTGEMLHHLSPLGLQVLKRITAQSVAHGTVPADFRKATVIPLPKPGKDTSLLDSWRPVSLTSIVSKLTERIILGRLLESLSLSEDQFGFRATRSTSDCIFSVLRNVTAMFNEYEDVGRPGGGARKYWSNFKTMARLYDLKAAYDRVDHSILLAKLADANVPRYLRRWVRNFLHQRTARVRVDPAMSRTTSLPVGVPQGSVISPVLFLIYIDSLLREVSQRCGVRAFADDVSTYISNPQVDRLVEDYVEIEAIVARWAAAHNMIISAKTTTETFNRNSKIAARPDGYSKLLGVTLDPLLSFVPFVDQLVASASARLLQLRRVAGQRFGPSTHSTRCFYLAYVHTLLTYSCEAWWPLISEKQRERLEIVHRRGLRIVAGLVSATRIEQVYYEARCPPLAVTAAKRLAKKVESDLRLPEDDIRHVEAIAPFRTSVQTTRSAQPLHFRPPLSEFAASARTQLNAVNRGATREPILTSRTVTVSSTVPTKRIIVRPFPVMEVLAEDPPEKKLEANVKAVTELSSSFAHSPLLRIATDASVAGGRSAGAAVLFPRGSDTPLPPLPLVDRRCGPLACSYRAEELTICRLVHALETVLAPRAEHPGLDWILVVSDSQSFLSELDTGPLRFKKNPIYASTWTALLRLAARGYTVALQFVFAHCGYDLNDAADERASFLNATLPAADDSDSWITDVLRVHADQYIDEPPQRALEQDLRRIESVRLAQLRSGESMEVGIFLRRIGTVQSMACRWCAPHLHVPAQPAPTSHLRRIRSTDPVRCLHCSATLASLKSFRSHMATQHPEAHLPPSLLSQRSAAARAARANPTPVPLNQEAQEPSPAELLAQRLADPPDGVARETVRHVLFECATLQSIRSTLSITSMQGLRDPPSPATTTRLRSVLSFLDSAISLLPN
jgi:hypothetical protein